MPGHVPASGGALLRSIGGRRGGEHFAKLLLAVGHHAGSSSYVATPEVTPVAVFATKCPPAPRAAPRR